MPEEKRPVKVFLCHAHSDRDKVRALYSRLRREGIDVWLDKEELLPGSDWEYEIRKAVREADVVVVCLSKQFNQAGFRQKEVRLALDTALEKPEGEIFILPARLEECDTLESLRKWHWVDLFEKDGYRRVLNALQIRANSLGIGVYSKNHEGDPSVKIIDPLSTNNLRVQMVDGWALFKVYGVSANAQGNPNLRIVILVHSEKPYVAGWWMQLFSVTVINSSSGDWHSEAQIGNQQYPPNIGDELEILAAVIPFEQIRSDPHIIDVKDIKPVAVSETIRFTIGEIK